MNRFRSGLVPLIAVAGLLSCSSEPTGDLRGDVSELVATPSQLFIELGGTKAVEVGALDAQGNPLDFNYEVTSAGSGITVRRDSSFLPIFVDDTTLQAPATGPRFRFIVEGTGYTQTSFTVSAGGHDIVVPVQVVPQTGLAATFDNAAPALGDTVTLTAPAGITFNPDATLDIGGNPVTIVSQDGSTIRFIPPPSVNSPVTVNGVVSAAAPDVVFSPATDTPLVTPLIDTVDVVYSTAAPAVGQSVTMTVPEPLINIVIDELVDTNSNIVYPEQLPGRAPGPQNIVVAADSSSVTFDAPPNANGSGTVVNFAFPGGYLIALPTRPTLTSGNIGLTLPATFSDINPDVSETVIMTAPAGFTFDPATVVTLGGAPATVVSNTGNTIGFVPAPGAAGIPQIDGVVPTAAPLNILTMPAEETITVPAEVPTLAGTDDPTTAPALNTPALNEGSVLFDRPNFAAQGFLAFYELTVTQAGVYDITMDWNVGTDLDLFVCETPVAPDFSNCDFQAATGAHPEHGAYDLAAGTYAVVSNDFLEDAAETTLIISVEHGPPAPPVIAGLRKAAPADPAKLQRLLRK
jgi:hypothetical protein